MQSRFLITILVAFGLNETQSSLLTMTLSLTTTSLLRYKSMKSLFRVLAYTHIYMITCEQCNSFSVERLYMLTDELLFEWIYKSVNMPWLTSRANTCQNGACTMLMSDTCKLSTLSKTMVTGLGSLAYNIAKHYGSCYYVYTYTMRGKSIIFRNTYYGIPPNLTLAIDRASTVNVNVFSAYNPPGASTLEVE